MAGRLLQMQTSWATLTSEQLRLFYHLKNLQFLLTIELCDLLAHSQVLPRRAPPEQWCGAPWPPCGLPFFSKEPFRKKVLFRLSSAVFANGFFRGSNKRCLAKKVASSKPALQRDPNGAVPVKNGEPQTNGNGSSALQASRGGGLPQLSRGRAPARDGKCTTICQPKKRCLFGHGLRGCTFVSSFQVAALGTVVHMCHLVHIQLLTLKFADGLLRENITPLCIFWSSSKNLHFLLLSPPSLFFPSFFAHIFFKYTCLWFPPILSFFPSVLWFYIGQPPPKTYGSQKSNCSSVRSLPFLRSRFNLVFYVIISLYTKNIFSLACTYFFRRV